MNKAIKIIYLLKGLNLCCCLGIRLPDRLVGRAGTAPNEPGSCTVDRAYFDTSILRYFHFSILPEFSSLFKIRSGCSVSFSGRHLMSGGHQAGFKCLQGLLIQLNVLLGPVYPAIINLHCSAH